MIDQTGSITRVPLEPDAIGWLDATHVATADEGDWKGGPAAGPCSHDHGHRGRGTAGAELERLAVRTGLHIGDRAAQEGRRGRGARDRDARR